MHRAKGDRFVRANELPVCDNGKVAVYRYTISAFWGKFRRPLAALDRCTLNRRHLHSKSFGGTLKWPFKGGSRLIEVTATAGLTVKC